MVDPTADRTKPYHVMLERLSDGVKAFYSSHELEEDANALAAHKNAQAANPKDLTTPGGVRYFVVKAVD